MTKIWTKFVPLGLCHKTKGMTLIMDLKSQWTRVNLNSNRTNPCAGLCNVSHAGVVSTLMARPDFLQYPAYHRPILPTPLG